VANEHFDETDRLILDAVQRRFPLVRRPFEVLAGRIGTTEDDLLRRLSRLKSDGVIREISGVFDSGRLGYHSALVTVSVRPEDLDAVAAAVSAHPGVSHNYERNHRFNLWFTLTLPRDRSIESEAGRLLGHPGVENFLVLPAVRRFKISVVFDLGTGEGAEVAEKAAEPERKTPAPLLEPAPHEIAAVRALQCDLPLESRPFAPLAAAFSMGEDELLDRAERFLSLGVMRRYGAVLRHRRAGWSANAMACWVIPDDRIEEAGRLASRERAVSHCYERKAFPPLWPYNLMTMIHGRSEEEVGAVVERLRAALTPSDFAVLATLREFKKERIRYFEF